MHWTDETMTHESKEEYYSSEDVHEACIYCGSSSKSNKVYKYGYVCPNCKASNKK